MITIPETRTLTLYLVDSDGQPVRAADDCDLAKAGFVAERLFRGAIETSKDWEAIAKRSESKIERVKAAVRKVAKERDEAAKKRDN